jgi:hypothetical protein
MGPRATSLRCLNLVRAQPFGTRDYAAAMPGTRSGKGPYLSEIMSETAAR